MGPMAEQSAPVGFRGVASGHLLIEVHPIAQSGNSRIPGHSCVVGVAGGDQPSRPANSAHLSQCHHRVGQMLQDLGREPTPAELATELDITPEKVLEIQQHARDPISLDQTIGDEGDSQLGDFIEDSQATVAVDAVSFTLLQDHLQSVLATLSEREASIIRLRFGLTNGPPRTLDEIGHIHGVTRERIRQIESKTMTKLRHPPRSQALRDSLD